MSTKSALLEMTIRQIDLDRAQWARMGSFSAKNKRKLAVKPVELRQAEDRRRTAQYRHKLDSLKRPETATVAAALLRAFVMQFDEDDLDAFVPEPTKQLIFSVMADLIGTGYDGSQVMYVLKRLRTRECSTQKAIAAA